MAATYNFTIKKGSTHRRTFAWTSGGVIVDLTGATLEMQGRDSTGTLIQDFTPYLSHNSAGGVITMDIPAATTHGWIWQTIFHDLKVTFADGSIAYPWEGAVTLEGSRSQ